jgi:putative membrane protein
MKLLIPIAFAAIAALPLQAAEKKSDKSLAEKTGDGVSKVVEGTKKTITKGVSTVTDLVSHGDKEFLKNASEMGRTEVAMGKLAEKKGGAEAKKLGETLVADHTKSNAELKTLLKKKNVEIKDEPTSAEKKMLSSLEGKSGAEFDKEFFEHAKKDHEKAIKSFEDAAKETKDADIKAFAEKNLKTLHKHHKMASK